MTHLCRSNLNPIVLASYSMLPKLHRKIKELMDDSKRTLADVVVCDQVDIKTDEVRYLSEWDIDLLTSRDFITDAIPA